MTDRDEERDERIEMEIIVDAYTADEQAMGWHIYRSRVVSNSAAWSSHTLARPASHRGRD